MNQFKRYHPLLIFHDIWNLVQNAIFFFIFLFIIQANSEFWLYKYGRFALVLIFILTLVYIPIKWLTSKYKLDNNALQLQQKLFTTNSRTIPYANIQHARRKTTLFHRVFNVTSLKLEIDTTGDNSSVTFHVLTPEEAAVIEGYILKKRNAVVPYEGDQSGPTTETFESNPSYRLHFTPTKKDIFKASLTSFSFIAIIPIAWSFISNIEQTFFAKGQIEGIFTNILNSWSWWMITIFLFLLTLVAIIFGIISTVLKYGRYEIASDFENIYITKGLLEETSFTITKANVQAVSVRQTFVKRILGLAEVKLICAGGSIDEDTEVNTLYPFLPVQRAYTMIHEILPTYQLTPTMERLPKKSLWLRLLRPSWFWIITTILLFYFKPDFLGIGMPWWMTSAILLVLVVISRLLSFFQSRYVLNDPFVQLKTGGFSTTLFLSKRNKIVEVELKRNIVQKKLGLASIVTSNRAKPVKRTRMNDIPVEWCKDFRRWYMIRGY